jgi:putative ABC transport system permease protein
MRWVQSTSIVFMVLLGVAVLFAFMLVGRGANDGLALSEQRAGAQLLLLPAKAGNYLSDTALLFSGAPVHHYMSSELFEEVRELEGVERATFQFFSQTLDASCCSASGETRLVGIDASSDWLVAPLLDDPAALSDGLADGQVIIGAAVDGFEKGTGRLLNNDVVVAAVMAATGTGLDSSIVVSADWARQLAAAIAGYQPFWELNGQPETLISAILLDVQPGREERLEAKLEALGDLRIVERSAVVAQTQQRLRAVFALLAGVAAVMALASLLQLCARYWSLSWERRGEFALYRALGATRGDLRRLICGEAFVLTGAGALLGLLVGGGLFALLLAQLSAAEAFPFLMPSIAVIALIALAVVAAFALLALLAIIIPLQRVARIEPALALQQTDIG